MDKHAMLHALVKEAMRRKLADMSAIMGGLQSGLGWAGRQMMRPVNMAKAVAGDAAGVGGVVAGGAARLVPPVALGAALGQGFASTGLGQSVARGGNKMMQPGGTVGSIPVPFSGGGTVGDVWKGLGQEYAKTAPVWAGGTPGAPAKMNPAAQAQWDSPSKYLPIGGGGGFSPSFGTPGSPGVPPKSTPTAGGVPEGEMKDRMSGYMSQFKAPEAAAPAPAAPKPVAQKPVQMPMSSTWMR